MKYLFVFIVIAALTSCNNRLPAPEIILPNGERIVLNDVVSFSRSYTIDYHQYEGFKGTLNDTYMQGYVLLFKTDSISSLVGLHLLDNSQIEKLKNEKLKGIRFDKIPDSKIVFNDLVKYLQGKYINCETKTIASTKKDIDKTVALYNTKTNKRYAIVQYVEFGIPGSIVILSIQI